MHRPDVSTTDYWFGNRRPSLPFPWFDNNITLNAPGLGLPTGRFQREANRPEPEVNRSQATVSASGLSSSSPPRLCDRSNASPLQVPSSTVELGLPDTDNTSNRRKAPPGGFASYESDCNLLERCSPDMNPEMSGLPDSDGNVSSSTPDDAYFVRFRSVSFCAGASSSATARGGIDPFKSESDPDVSSYSILESILLNRNVPPFYLSAAGSSDRHPVAADLPNELFPRAACDDDFVYKRPRLHSMPLPSSIPPIGHSTRGVDADQCRREDEPVCLAFRRRKVSLESQGHRTAENDISSPKMAANNGLRQFKSPKFQRKRSILHSLLTFESKLDRQSDDDDDERPENGDVTRRQSSGPEVDRCNLVDRTSCHVVDSTESLPPTLEKLVLGGGGGGDRSRPAGGAARQQRVVIAKKMAPVVNRKVAKWLTEIAQLAARYRDLAGLPREDWIVLLQSAVSRLLLLFMAENNFQFAVAPVAATDRRQTTASDGEAGDERGRPVVSPAEIPTAGSAEDIQRFIAKCQALKVDGREYQCMRLITLFHSGCTNGLRRIAMVDHIKSGACKILQNLVRQSRPDDKLRYGELLLHLHSLASVNSRMIQRLFNISPSGREDGHTQLNECMQWLERDDAA